MYLIQNDYPTGDRPTMYIGSKQFYSHTTKRLPGRKNRKHTVKESDLQSYYGSCDELTADIERFGVDCFSREILMICNSKFELHYHEAKTQFDHEVLLKPDVYYNRNILRTLFTPRRKLTIPESGV